MDDNLQKLLAAERDVNMRVQEALRNKYTNNS